MKLTTHQRWGMGMDNQPDTIQVMQVVKEKLRV